MAKYLKPGAGETFVEDTAEIEYLKFNNLRHSVSGFMLGDFDEHGIYSVDLQIVKELIKMKKYIVDTLDDDIEICHSQIVLLGPITFLVSYEQDCATLSLIEKVNYESNIRDDAGAYSNINEYVLDTVQTSGLINKEVIYRRWNISLFKEGAHRKLSDLDEETYNELMGIAERFKYLLYVNTMFAQKEEDIEQIEASYTEAMMQLIARFPKLKAAVDKAIKENLTAKKDFIKLDKPQLAKTINELIEQVVEDNIDQLTKKEKEEFLTDRHIIQNNYNIEMADVIPQKVEKPIIRGVQNPVGKVVVETNHKQNQPIKQLAQQLVEERKKNTERAEHAAVEYLAEPEQVEKKPDPLKPQKKKSIIARVAAALGATNARQMRENNVQPSTVEAAKTYKANKNKRLLSATTEKIATTTQEPKAKGKAPKVEAGASDGASAGKPAKSAGGGGRSSSDEKKPVKKDKEDKKAKKPVAVDESKKIVGVGRPGKKRDKKDDEVIEKEGEGESFFKKRVNKSPKVKEETDMVVETLDLSQFNNGEEGTYNLAASEDIAVTSANTDKHEINVRNLKSKRLEEQKIIQELGNNVDVTHLNLGQ